MKKLFLFFISGLVAQQLSAQIAGNINNEPYAVAYPEHMINISYPSGTGTYISIKGLANIKPDALVAIYAIQQTGKTVQETNELMDNRVKEVEANLKKFPEVKVYTDMITMVPLYELQAEKKLFSKKTYNEVPAGFELKKNIHIQFKRGEQINEIMKVLSEYEIYDLVRVDYTINNIDSIKKEMISKARGLMLDRIKHYEALIGDAFSNKEKNVSDGFKLYLPTEMYRKYTLYQNTSLNNKLNPDRINVTYKSSTNFYMPVANKDFDFVINPTLLEPAVQVLYEIKWSATAKVEEKKTNLLFMNHNGDLKPIPVNN